MPINRLYMDTCWRKSILLYGRNAICYQEKPMKSLCSSHVHKNGLTCLRSVASIRDLSCGISSSSSLSPLATYHTHLSLLLRTGRLSWDHLCQIHALIYTCGFLDDNLLATRLIGHFSLSANVDTALLHFQHLCHPNIYTVNAIIRVVAQTEDSSRPFSFYKLLCRLSLCPNDFTFVFLLKAFSRQSANGYVLQIHPHIAKSAFGKDLFVQTVLLGAYGNGCKDMTSAHKVFDEMCSRNVTSWTLLVSGYAQARRPEEALSLFLKMIQERDVLPNDDMMVSVLSACSILSFEDAHNWKDRFLQDVGIHFCCHVDTALVYLLAKCGDIAASSRVFDDMPNKTLVSWNAMITGYLQAGYAAEALVAFHRMNLKPNHVTMVAVLSACAKVGALDTGKWLHDYIVMNGPKGILQANAILATALLDMYVKCGNLHEAFLVFEKMNKRDVVAYNAMIMGLAIHGKGREALTLFSQMQAAGVLPNEVSFLALLCVCVHAGMVEEGISFFSGMHKEYGIIPNLQHHTCLVDLLGRAGRVEEALKVIREMPMEPSVYAWGSLLGSCQVHSKLNAATDAVKDLMDLDRLGSAGYVIMSNLYALEGYWGFIPGLRQKMKEKGIAKYPGCSWICVDGVIHEFLVGATLHLEHKNIFDVLDSLFRQIKSMMKA